MYTSNMNRIHRSPEAGEGGGNAPNPPAGGDGGSANPSAAEPAWDARAAHESLANEMRQGFSRFNQPQRQEPPKGEGEKGPKSRPKVSDYDMSKDPNAWDKYQDDMEDWRESQREIKRTAAQAESTAKERGEKTLRGHQARVLEYKKENPSFDEDVRKAGLQAEKEVSGAIFAHKESPAVIHHMASNPALLDELNQMALSGDADSIPYRVGEIAGEIRAAKKLQDANKNAAGDRPPRQNFRGNSAPKDREPTAAERYKKYNS